MSTWVAPPISFTLRDARDKFTFANNNFTSKDHLWKILQSGTVHGVQLSFPHQQPNAYTEAFMREFISKIVATRHITFIKFHFVRYTWPVWQYLKDLFCARSFDKIKFTGSCHLSNNNDIAAFLIEMSTEHKEPRVLLLHKCTFLYDNTNDIIKSLTSSTRLEYFSAPDTGIIDLDSNIDKFVLIPTLRHLRFSHNYFYDCVSKMMEGLVKMNTISSLVFDSSLIDEEILFSALPQLHSLNELEIGARRLDKSKTELLVSYIESTDVLYSLTLSNVTLDENLIPKFFKAFEANTSIRICDICHSSEDYCDNKDDIISMFNKNTTLKRFSIFCENSTYTPDVITEIMAVLETRPVPLTFRVNCSAEDEIKLQELVDLSMEKNKNAKHDIINSHDISSKRLRSQ